MTRFAWADMLYDVARVEWKYGRNDLPFGKEELKDYSEWNNVREHLKENNAMRPVNINNYE